MSKKFNEPEETMVYKTFISIIKENKYIQLADDKENSKKFIKPIFNLLEVLLRANCFHQFKKAVQLLNLINDSLYIDKTYNIAVIPKVQPGDIENVNLYGSYKGPMSIL
jgi:hypothetical protein